MSEKWLRDLDVLDHLEMPSTVRESVGKNAPPSPSGQPFGRRLITIGVAFAVFVGAGVFAWQAFRSSAPLPSNSQPSSIDGTILWPEQTGADLAATQTLADSGDASVSWRLDPQAVATRFAEDVLGWGPAGGIYEVSLDGSGSSPSPAPEGALTASLSQRAIPCPTPPPDEQISCPPPFAMETLWLRQAGSTGPSGVWSVQAAFASGLDLTVQPGDELRNSDSSVDGNVSFPATAAKTSGFTAQGGFFVGTGGECSSGSIEGIHHEGGLSVDVKIGALGWSASGCPAESIGLAWIATASPPTCPQGVSCYFTVLVSPDLRTNYAHLYGLTAIPILVSALGEQPSPAPAANSYVNPMGIPITVDYPSEWFAQSVSQDSNLDPAVTGPRQIGLVVSNTGEAMPSPGAESPSPGPLPEDPNLPSDFVSVTILARDVVTHGPQVPDSNFPLSMDDANVAPGAANVRVLDAVVAGRAIEITVRAGPTASGADLARADALVASIRPSHDAVPR